MPNTNERRLKQINNKEPITCAQITICSKVKLIFWNKSQQYFVIVVCKQHVKSDTVKWGVVELNYLGKWREIIPNKIRNTIFKEMLAT